jgi:hypothetical protein
MTDEQARQLRAGDRVLCSMIEGLVPAEVVEVLCYPAQAPRVWVRRLGGSRRGGRFPSHRRRAEELYFVARPFLETANVYADWLEEQGEYRAAALLRAAFPLPPAEEVA